LHEEHGYLDGLVKLVFCTSIVYIIQVQITANADAEKGRQLELETLWNIYESNISPIDIPLIKACL